MHRRKLWQIQEKEEKFTRMWRVFSSVQIKLNHWHLFCIMLAWCCSPSSMIGDAPSHACGLHNTAVVCWLCLTAERLFLLAPRNTLIFHCGKINIGGVTPSNPGWDYRKRDWHGNIYNINQQSQKNIIKQNKSRKMAYMAWTEIWTEAWKKRKIKWKDRRCVFGKGWANPASVAVIKRFPHTHSSDNSNTSWRCALRHTKQFCSQICIAVCTLVNLISLSHLPEVKTHTHVHTHYSVPTLSSILISRAPIVGYSLSSPFPG